MYILIDKMNKECYPGDDLGIISEKSGVSVFTLRSWTKKFNKEEWYDGLKFTLIKRERLKGKRGGINEGNMHLFRR